MISIIIPLYNKESSIENAIRSIISQSYTDTEIIIVDDGSTDKSLSVVEQIQDGRILIIKQNNSGPGAARNTGFKHAKGEWIVFLDADDELCENALNVMIEKCQQHPNADIIDFNKYLRINNELILQRHPIEGRVRNPLKEWYYRRISPGCGHSIFKSSFVRKYPYNELYRRYEDADLLLRMLPSACVYSSTIPTEIHDMDTAAASMPRKNINEDFVGHLNLNGSFWYQMCSYRLFIEERNYYPIECPKLYPTWYWRIDLFFYIKFYLSNICEYFGSLQIRRAIQLSNKTMDTMVEGGWHHYNKNFKIIKTFLLE